MILYKGCKALTFSSGIDSSLLRTKAKEANNKMSIKLATENQSP
jgi:hypothetical protein